MENGNSETKVNNILFVDDDAYINIALRELVEKNKAENKQFFNLIVKNNARDALEVISTLEIDLVILEIALPIISGYQLIEAIHKKYPHISIIIYTKLKRPQDLAIMAGKRVNNIILKELVDIKQLINQISDQKKVENIDETVFRLNDQIKQLMGSGHKTMKKLTQCPKCHLILSPDSQFCHNCGQKIAKKQTKKLIQTPVVQNNKETK